MLTLISGKEDVTQGKRVSGSHLHQSSVVTTTITKERREGKMKQSKVTGRRVLSALLVGTCVAIANPAAPVVLTAKAEASTAAGLSLTLDGQSWGENYGVNASLSNNTGKQVEDWKIVLDGELTIDQIWSAVAVTENGTTVITPMDWDRNISANGSVQFGFNGTGIVPTGNSYTVAYKIDGVWSDGSAPVDPEPVDPTPTDPDDPTPVDPTPVTPEDPDEPTPVTPETPDGKVTVTYDGNGWDGGYTLNVAIKNDSSVAVEDWKLEVGSLNVDSVWCATTEDNGNLVFTPLEYNKTIPAGNSATFGFNGTGAYPGALKGKLTYKVNGQWITAGEEPVTPVQPEDPDHPEDPDQPVNPVDPDHPEDPDQPEDPVIPEEKSSDTRLSIVRVRGIDAVQIDDTTYVVTLPEGFKKSDIRRADFFVRTVSDKAKMLPVNWTLERQTGIIFVTAEDGTQTIYTIKFEEAAPVEVSSDTTLASVTLKGVEAVKVDDVTYAVTLPEGIKYTDIKREDFVVTLNSDKATMVPVNWTVNRKAALILVTAEDGTQVLYTVNVTAEEAQPEISSDTAIDAIAVKNVLATKTGDTTYEVTLPANNRLSALTKNSFAVKKHNVDATAIVRYSLTRGLATIAVQAPNGDVKVYTVQVKIAESEPIVDEYVVSITVAGIEAKRVYGPRRYEVVLPEGMTRNDITKDDIVVTFNDNFTQNARKSQIGYTARTGRGGFVILQNEGRNLPYDVFVYEAGQ